MESGFNRKANKKFKTAYLCYCAYDSHNDGSCGVFADEGKRGGLD